MANLICVKSGVFVDLDRLTPFIHRSKINTYATGGGLVTTKDVCIPGNIEHEYTDDCFYYRDSYCGYFSAPGRELAYLTKVITIPAFIPNHPGALRLPVWSMSYDGGMLPPYNMPTPENLEYAHYVFGFLKKGLSAVPKDLPFRGPSVFTDEGYPELEYHQSIRGDITRFHGPEYIIDHNKNSKRVFAQGIAGGVIIHK